MLSILPLYGLAAILLGYVVSYFVSGPLKSFLVVVGMSVIMYAIATISFAASDLESQHVCTGLTQTGWVRILGCSSDGQTDAGHRFWCLPTSPHRTRFQGNAHRSQCSRGRLQGWRAHAPSLIYGFGGPIIYLILQVTVLLAIIIWIEGDVVLFRRKVDKVAESFDREKDASYPTSDEVKSEELRVEGAESDLLRALHLSKSFGINQAVDNITFGLPRSDFMALIGSNGAGKSTLVNMVQSELSPDTGHVLLRDEDARTRSAQKYLGGK